MAESFLEGLTGSEEEIEIIDPFDEQFLGRTATPTQKEAWPLCKEYGSKVATIGGKGSGKTVIGGALLAWTVQAYPGCKLFMSAATYNQASESSADKLVTTVDMLGIQMQYRQSMIIDRKEHKHVYYFPEYQSYICVRSADNMDMIEGSEWDGGTVEEVQLWPERKLKVALARIRRNKRNIFKFIAGLPGDEDEWYYHFFKEAGFTLFEIDTRENAHNLDPDYIPGLMSMYKGAEFERYICGRRSSIFSSPVFTSYNEEIHKKGKSTWVCSYDPYKTIILSFDFNVYPMSVSAWQIKRIEQKDNQGYKRITTVLVQINEWEEWTNGTAGICEQILDDYGDHKHGIEIVGDANGNKQDTRSASQTDYTIIADKFERVPDVYIRQGLMVNRKSKNGQLTFYNPPKKDSIQLCNSLLVRPNGTVGVFMLPNSSLQSNGVAGAVRSLRYTADGRVDDSSDKLVGRQVKRTHFADTFRYVVWHVTGGHLSGGRLADHSSDFKSGVLRGGRRKTETIRF